MRAKPTRQGAVVKALYEGVDMERALFLTREYLFDAFRCASDRPRLYQWNAHPLGAPEGLDETAWSATSEFDGGKLWEGVPSMAGSTRGGGFDLKNVRKRGVGEGAWDFRTRQGSGVGVRPQMLGAPDTTLFHDTDGGITTVIVQRRVPTTVFAALHEPYRATPSGLTFSRVAESADGMAVRVGGPKTDDRVLLAYSDAAARPLILAGGDESFTFVGQAFIRASDGEVRVSGDLRAMRLTVTGRPVLIVNGARKDASVVDGRLVYAAGE